MTAPTALKNNRKRIRKIIVRLSFVWFIIWYCTCLPKELFNDPISLVLVDQNDHLLGAHVAQDEQWRFPENPTINEKFEKALITYEDKRFYDHLGVDIWSLGRAIKSNLSNNRVVSGASTLTMQVIRLSRKNPSRSYFEKLTEMFRATRLEMRHSKKEILAMYASHAPFGGNVVGLDAASWKYFGKSQDKLTWAEASMLAVLPNAPGLIHLSKNRKKLLAKRNELLNKLFVLKYMDASTCELAKMEPLPSKPKALPSITPHLLSHFLSKSKTGLVKTTIDIQVQQQTNYAIDKQLIHLKGQAVHNASALVVELKTGNILSYVGNTKEVNNTHQNSVNMIKAKRSSGSILKPLLYAEALDKGIILPHSLIADVPVDFYGYTPKNFNLTYDGVVPANQIISRSLNIPSVHLLNTYGVHSFLHKLKGYGFSSINKSGNHYGLPLILGGAEVKPIHVAQTYANFAQKLLGYELKLSIETDTILSKNKTNKLPGEASIWHMFNAMLQVSRPNSDNSWKVFNNEEKIAWKTGTSFGGRDAWAVGCNSNYVVVVWTGNSDGEGRPNLTGVSSASPIMFDIFNQLPQPNDWFILPKDKAIEIAICKKSGHKATTNCKHQTHTFVPKQGNNSSPCSYCSSVALDSTGQFRVDGSNYPPLDRVNKTYFILQPSQAVYYKKTHADYQALPPLLETKGAISLIYPRNKGKIYLPKKDSNKRSQLVLRGQSNEEQDELFWTLDDQFIGSTIHQHELAVTATKGIHDLVVTNTKDDRKQITFEIVE